MKISESGYEFIKKLEGFRAKAYLCPAGVATIGYGHTKDTILGMTITEPYADTLLRNDCKSIISILNKIPVSLSQNQFDAIASFIYNVGITAFLNSTMCEKLNSGNTDIASEFGRWVYCNGKKLKGLQNRRNKESMLYSNGNYDI